MSAPTIGIVVTDAYSEDDADHDTPLLIAALRERGAIADPVIWHRGEDLSPFDLVLLRSPWDYPERLAEFTTWLARAGESARVRNSPATVRWNLDKRYLADLAGAGIPVVPTAYAETASHARQLLPSPSAVVVKPAVSAGARDTGLFDGEDPAALALAERIVSAGGVAMIQPEIPELTAGGEKAIYVIDGRFTHAIAKGALLARGGGLLAGTYREHPEAVPATDAERSLAESVLRAVSAVTAEPLPLYARIDLVDTAAYGLVVLEAELIEPSLNLHVAPQALAPVADAILAAAAAV